MPRSSMFDLFPNELLYEVFEYLTTYQILSAFNRLNKRIDTLLQKYAKYNLNFQSWSKSKFDFVCQLIQPEQIRSLILSDGDDTCRQIHLFFGLFYIRQFVNLEFLTLIEITEQDLNKLVTKFHLLSKLSYLSIKLTDGLIPIITIPSLKYLSIGICSMSQLYELLLSIPSLTNLNVQLIADTNPADKTFLLATEIRQLKIELAEKSNITFDDIQVLFKWMPKLRNFTFIAAKGFNFIRGDRWEDLIRTHLPQLKQFHFKIHPNLHNINPKQLLSSFQTPFWLKENQWFINCDHHRVLNIVFRNRSTFNIHLYTLPYTAEQFHLSLTSETETNVCKEEFSSIKNLYLSIDCYRSLNNAKRYYFPNLDSLTIQNLDKLFSFDKLINLSQIKHLTIEQNNKIHSEEFFSCILIHSIKLQSLKLSWHTLAEITKNFTDQQVCDLLNKQIKNLTLVNMIPDNGEDNCKPIEIINKIFSTNLEKISLSVTSMDHILLVLNEMYKLYSVKIEYNPVNTMMNNEELLVWLMKNVPRLKNFTYQIRLAMGTRVCLLLWIGH